MNNYESGSYCLIQFKEKGHIITYMPDYPPLFYNGLGVYAIFKVKLKIKDNRNWIHKIFNPNRFKTWLGRHLICNQSIEY